MGLGDFSMVWCRTCRSPPLARICNAGPWRSNAVIRYLDECDLEEDVALEAALHVEDEEWID